MNNCKHLGIVNPSIDSLLQKIPNRYALTVLAAKKSHELSENESNQKRRKSNKFLTLALEEINVGNVDYKLKE